MSLKNIRKSKDLFMVVLKLSLKPYHSWINTTFPFWYGAFIGLYSVPYFSFIYADLVYSLIFLILPLIVVLVIMINFYRNFNKITLHEKNFHLNINLNDFLEIPSFILSEFFATRFSFKLKLYGDALSKIQGQRIALIIIKPPTINIFIKPRTQLNQEYNDGGDIFYLTQDYEINSSQLSFVTFIQAEGAIDAKRLELYLICEDSLQRFLEDYTNDPLIRPKGLVTKEEFYLSTTD